MQCLNHVLPVRLLDPLAEEEISKVDINNLLPGFYNVDLEYPKELHDLHNDFPLAPEHIGEGNNKRLISNLNDKKGYILHYELLKTYLKLGLKLKRINEVIPFEEEAFMKPYIEKNTKLRQESNSKIKKDIYKLKNNSVYGKKMENVRKYKDIKILNMESSASGLKDIATPTFQSITEFPGYSLGLSHDQKTCCEMNKPIYIGSTVLDLSKKTMYEFLYDYVKPKWGDKAKLLFTDTDSFCFQLVGVEDPYEDMAPDVEEWFDTSNFPLNHPSGIKVGVNEMVPGKMKDELAGKQVLEFCGLNAKTYSFDNGER